MPELVRLIAVLGSLFGMWFVSAGLLIHVGVWGWYGIELGWSQIYPILIDLANEADIPSTWLPGGGWFHKPSWRLTLEWTVWTAGVMSAFPVISYIALPLRSQVKSALGPQAWALTKKVSPDETLGELFASVKREVGVHKPVSLYLASIRGPMAFAMGAPFRGTVVLSQGLLNALTRDELEWVMAHELGHIRYRDMMLGALWISSIQGLNLFERLKISVLRVSLWLLGMFRTPVFVMRLLIWFIQVSLSAISVGRWFALKFFLLLDRWVSRRTEYRADKFAAESFGGHAEARALTRLGGDAEPLFNGLFATHPKISSRIRRLMQ